MKTFFSTIAISIMLINFLSNAQNITNTLGADGKFKIKDGTNDFLSVDQKSGDLTIFRNFIIPAAAEGDALSGVIYMGEDRFIHTYHGSGTYGNNLFIGTNAGNFTMGGNGLEGSYNTGVGYGSLYSISTGSRNSAFGILSLRSNTTGFANSAFGQEALFGNTTGSYNSAFGLQALYYNTTGDDNSAFGQEALFRNTTGFGNSAFGEAALNDNTTGNYNTSIGYFSGYYNTTGSNNITIGYNALVPSGSGSNQVRIGNTSITYAGIQVAWTVTSDRRWKENIKPTNLGLDFINNLNPVSYTRNNDENHRTEYGLIAQDLEEVLKSEGIDNAGMITVTNDGYYELRYNDLLAPMIKAIQELKAENDSLRSEIDNLKSLKEQVAEIQDLKSELIQQINQMKSENKISDSKLTLNEIEVK